MEWQCGTTVDTIWEGLIQFRPSGIRVKTPKCFPALVAMVQIPIIGRYKRRLSVREAARLQSFPASFIPNVNDQQAYKQFGNAVNVEVIRRCGEKLFECKKGMYKEKELKEEIARQVLVYFDEKKFDDLYLGESPDIRSKTKSLGIEVTDAKKEHLQEIDSHVMDILGKKTSDLNKNNVKNLQNGEIETCLINNGVVAAAGPKAYWGSDFDFCKAITKKLSKLNSRVYTKYDENDLFIFALNMDEIDKSTDLQKIESIDYLQYDIRFDYIYFFSGKEIIKYDVDNKRFLSKKIDYDLYSQIIRDAKAILQDN